MASTTPTKTNVFDTVAAGMMRVRKLRRDETVVALRKIAFGPSASNRDVAVIQAELLIRILGEADDDIKRMTLFAWAIAIARGSKHTVNTAQRILLTDLSADEIAVALADAVYAELTIIDFDNTTDPFRIIAPDFDLANSLGASPKAPVLEYAANDHIQASDISLEAALIWTTNSPVLQELRNGL